MYVFTGALPRKRIARLAPKCRSVKITRNYVRRTYGLPSVIDTVTYVCLYQSAGGETKIVATKT